jgi:hypothetical protein
MESVNICYNFDATEIAMIVCNCNGTENATIFYTEHHCDAMRNVTIVCYAMVSVMIDIACHYYDERGILTIFCDEMLSVTIPKMTTNSTILNALNVTTSEEFQTLAQEILTFLTFLFLPLVVDLCYGKAKDI